MAEKLDPRQVVTFEELLRAMMYEQGAARLTARLLGTRVAFPWRDPA